MFPALDPIPLPAPVWLLKGLLLLTTVLHLAAVYLLLGGMFFASLWAIWGRSRGNGRMIDSSGALATRLPLVMTYVINLGVPPLLFAQVLYGRALYASSVLIGVWWIAVVFLLMASYTLLYVMGSRSKSGKVWGWIGFLALLVVVKIGYIYSTNMTLMLRPEDWGAMYRNSPLGGQLHASDPTVLPRWVFMLIASVTVSGVGMIFLGMKKFLTAEASAFLRMAGARIAIAGAAFQIPAGMWVMNVQSKTVMVELSANPLWQGAELGWLVTSVLILAAALLVYLKASSPTWLLVAVPGLAAFLNICCTVLVRDGIRDATLLTNGFDVWERTVVSNWTVIGAFLLLFVAGLGVIAWLAAVVAKAEGKEERYA